MSESNNALAAAQAEVATRNARAAIRHSEETRKVVDEKIENLERALNIAMQKIATLEGKYNLLLTSSFRGGSTSGE